MVERTLFLNGTIAEDSWFDDDVTPQMFKEELMDGNGNITVWINSPGGDCVAAAQIYNMLREYEGKVTVKIDGIAASAASVIAMAGDEIVMPKNTMMMIHNMWMGAVGNAAQLRKAADDLDVINAAGRQAYLDKAGDKLSEEALAQMMDAETWLTAQQCIDLGLADRYAQEDADLSKTPQLLQRANTALAANVESLAAKVRAMSKPPMEKEPEENTKKPEREPAAKLAQLFGGFLHK